jgi:hypothetical protein
MDAPREPGPDTGESHGPDGTAGESGAVGRTDESGAVGRTDESGAVGRTDKSSAAGRTDESGAAETVDVADDSDLVVDGPARQPPGDGGVLFRLARRTAITAGVLGVAVLLITATGLLWPGWFARPAGLTVGVLLVVGCALAAVMLLRRSGSWTALTASTLRDAPGIPTVVGEPRPLHGPRPTVVRRRRYAAQVVPIRSTTGPWTSGAALIVHGRADGIALRADDDVVARWVHPRGPYLLQRPEDGALFAAERSTLGAW